MISSVPETIELAGGFLVLSTTVYYLTDVLKNAFQIGSRQIPLMAIAIGVLLFVGAYVSAEWDSFSTEELFTVILMGIGSGMAAIGGHQVKRSFVQPE